MRIVALFALGMPVLAVSGAVAYGSIQQISTSFQARDVVPLVATVPAPNAKAADFVQASATTWDLPPEPAVLPASLAAYNGAGGADDKAGSTVQSQPVVVSLVRPEPRLITPSQKPKIILSTGKKIVVVPKAGAQPTKSKFKMPWQTGIYQ